MGAGLQNLNYLSQSVNNGQMPVGQEGPRAIPLNLDFTTATGNTSVLLDLKQAQAMAKVSYIQTIFVDNSGSPGITTINVQGLSQAVIIPAGCQAYLPLLAINPPVLVCVNNSNVKVPIQLLNFPLPPCVWNVGTQAIKVDVPNLDALIGNWNGGGNSLAVGDLALYALATTGAGLKIQGGGGAAIANKQTFSSGFGFSTVTYISGTAGKSIILNSVSAVGFGTGGHNGIFGAAAGTLVLYLQDGANPIKVRRIDYPAADPAVPTSTIVWDLFDINYQCALGGGVTCQVIGGGGLTSGAYDVSCTYELV